VSARTNRPSIPAAAILPVPMVPALISVYGKDEARARGVPAVPSGRTRSNGEAHLRRRSAAERRQVQAQVGRHKPIEAYERACALHRHALTAS